MGRARIDRIVRYFLAGALGITLGVAAAVAFMGEMVDLAVDSQTQKAIQGYESSRRIETYHGCSNLTGIEKLYCTDQAARHAREGERQEYETAADEKQAIWTKASAAIAGSGLIFSLVTILAVFLSWGEQRQANLRAKEEFLHSRKVAAETAAASDRTFRHADITARARLRTYLNSMEESVAFDDSGRVMNVKYVYKNVGLTPAHDVEYESKATIEPIDESVESRWIGNNHIEYGLVGPTSENSNYARLTIMAEEVAAIKAGKALIRIETGITYRDEFGDHWQFDQIMQIDQNSYRTGLVYTDRCETRLVTADEAHKTDGELPLEGGSEKA